MPKKILLVEDYEVLREFVAEVLVLEGSYTVVAVCNGQEAWEILDRGEKFDLILSDKDMPKMNGLELLQRVREDSRTTYTPFLLVSGDDVVSRDDPTPLQIACRDLEAHFRKKPLDYFSVVSELLKDE